MAKPLRCDDFLELLNESLDNGRDPMRDERIADHAHVCSACNSTLEEYLKVEHLARIAFHNSDWARSNLTVSALYGQRGPQAPAHNGSGRMGVGSRNISKYPLRTILGTLAASIVILVAWERREMGGEPQVIESHREVQGAVADLVFQENSEMPSPRPANPIFSLNNCYEITSELPGIRPIRSSLDATLNLIHQIVPVEYRIIPPAKPPGVGIARNSSVFSV